MYPEYADTSGIDELRDTEYSYLDECGHVYLDYTGAGLAARSQLRGARGTDRRGLLRQPALGEPDLERVYAARRAGQGGRSPALQRHRDDYAVIFTPNATGACRLVGEAYPFRRGSRLVLTADNHNSVNGIREFARARGARSLRPAHRAGTAGRARPMCSPRCPRADGGRPGLFAYPAQSNFSGVQHPLRLGAPRAGSGLRRAARRGGLRPDQPA